MVRQIDINSAIVVHDAATVLRMLQSPIEQRVLDGALMCAIRYGRFEYIELLVDKGASVDARFEPIEKKPVRPRTPEEQAAIDAAYEAQLKKLGLEPIKPPQDEYSKYVRTIGHAKDHGIYGGQTETALIFASRGAMLLHDLRIFRGDITFERSRCPEWMARAQRAHLEMVSKLIELGADVEAQDSIGRTPLMEVIQGYYRGVDLMVDNERGFEHVGMLNPILVMEQLIGAGTNLDIQDQAGNTALILWVNSCHARESHEHMPGLRLLLDSGCDVNLRRVQGHTALVDTATSRFVPMVRALLDAGADVSIPDKLGFGVLHHVVHFGNTYDATAPKKWLDTLQMLVDAGAEVNARAPKARTPLHLAAGGGVAIEIVQILLDAGAEVKAVDELGLTPYALAEQRKHDHLLPLLRA